MLLLHLLFFAHIKTSLTACYMHFLLSTIGKIFSQNTIFLLLFYTNLLAILLMYCFNLLEFLAIPEHHYPAFRSTKYYTTKLYR